RLRRNGDLIRAGSRRNGARDKRLREHASDKHDHLPEVRASGRRADADECLRLLLRLQGMRRAAQAAAWRLLRVLLVWLGGVSAGAGRLLREGRRVLTARTPARDITP